MRIISKKIIENYGRKHPEAKAAIYAWFHDVSQARWSSPQEITAVYRNASIITGERVVFNVRGNSYRIVVGINYEMQVVYIRFVGSHAEYDRTDASTI